MTPLSSSSRLFHSTLCWRSGNINSTQFTKNQYKQQNANSKGGHTGPNFRCGSTSIISLSIFSTKFYRISAGIQMSSVPRSFVDDDVCICAQTGLCRRRRRCRTCRCRCCDMIAAAAPIVNASEKCVSHIPCPVGFQHGRSRFGIQMPSLQQETQEQTHSPRTSQSMPASRPN
jgi:hypothetical protein